VQDVDHRPLGGEPSGCSPSYLNGIQERIGVLTVNQTGNSVSMSASGSGFSCSFSGTYSQAGKLGQVDGSAV
jgi:hypothetical protein